MKILVGINIVLWALYVIGCLTIYDEENLIIRVLFAYYRLAIIWLLKISIVILLVGCFII